MSNRWYRVDYEHEGEPIERTMRVSAPGPKSAAAHVRALATRPITVVSVTLGRPADIREETQ